MAILEPEFKRGAVKQAKAVGQSATGFVKKHKWITGAVGGYAVGVKVSPYGDTSNQGRAVNKHPYGGYYG